MNDSIKENDPAPILEEKWLGHFQSLHSNERKSSMQQQEVYDELQQLQK